MNWVDIAILVVLAILLAKGLWLGLIHELSTLAGLAGGTILAIRYRGPLGQVLQNWLKVAPELLTTLAAVLLFLITLTTCVLIGVLLSRVVKLLFLGGFNRVLGGLFGLLQGVLLLTLLLHGLALTNWWREARQDSRLAPPFVALGDQLIGEELLLPK
jgi:membrane protein required for colicin V production